MSFLAPLLAVLVSVAPPPAPDEEALPPMPSSGLVLTHGRLETDSITTTRFRIVFTPRAKGAAEFLAKEIESIRDEVATTIGRDWPGVTEIRLGFGREEYEALALPGGVPPSWAVALAYPDRNIVLVEAHSLVQDDGQTTLRHELVHAGLGQLGTGWPRWFQEGLAQELTGERRYRLEQYATLARAVAIDRVFRFQDLAQGFPSRPEDVEIAYAQSAAFVAFLKERHGAEAFGTLIDRVGAGDAFEKAFGIAFRSPLSVEEKAFHGELPIRYPWWPLLLSGGTALWAVMSLLVVVAWVRRRQQRAVRRAEMIRVEHLEEIARAIALRAARPDNDERSIEEWLLPPWAPWYASSVTGLRVEGRERPEAPPVNPAAGDGRDPS
ncbi:MAG: peptidase MA family metallohydrolase [Myxococcota bacterium]